MLNRMRQFDAAAADPGMVAPAHFQRGIFGDLLPRLIDFLLADKDRACHHECLRPGAAFGQPAFDQ